MKGPYLVNRLFLGIIFILSIPLMCLAECDQEDAPDCTCFNDTGDWDAGGPGPWPGDIIQDVALTTLGTIESCQCPGWPGCAWGTALNPFDDSGKPYYQIVLGQNRVAGGLTMAYVLDVTGGTGFDERVAWCSEAISYWHRETGIPYPGGYRNDWHLTWLNYCVPEMKFWYAVEESFGPPWSRGRWVKAKDIDYHNFELGMTAPVPGAYMAWAPYNSTSKEYFEIMERAHSLMVNEMWVHRDKFGTVFKIRATFIEGNSNDQVRNTRDWDDIRSLTPQGADWIGADKKIYGFGIDLDSSGNPIYDPARLHFEDHPDVIAALPPAHVNAADPIWENFYGQRLAQVVTYGQMLLQTNGPHTSTSQGLANTISNNPIPDGLSNWVFPGGSSLLSEFVQIDLMQVHPLPIKGVELRWRLYETAYLPTNQDYKVRFSHDCAAYTDAAIPDIGNVPHFGNAPYPVSVPAVFGGDDFGVPVRCIQLIWERSDPLPNDAVLEEIRFNYDNRLGEDSPDNPIYLKESVASVPVLNSWGVLIFMLLMIGSTAWFIRRKVSHG